MKFTKIFGFVLFLHVLIVSFMLIQPGCVTKKGKNGSTAEDTLPENAPLVVKNTTGESGDGSLHPDFNAGFTASDVASERTGGLYPPTRPTWKFNSPSEPESTSLLQPMESPSEEFGSGQDYKIKTGDTLWGIARANNLPLDDLLTANGFDRSTVIQIGQIIVIPEANSIQSSDSYADDRLMTNPELADGILYTVQSGDTLSGIAKRYNTSITAIKEENALTSDMIRVEQRLRIPSPSASQAGNTPSGRAAPAVKTSVSSHTSIQYGDVTHVVQSGENPTIIARKYGISVKSLMAANGISDPRKLKVGQVLVIHKNEGNIQEQTPRKPLPPSISDTLEDRTTNAAIVEDDDGDRPLSPEELQDFLSDESDDVPPMIPVVDEEDDNP